MESVVVVGPDQSDSTSSGVFISYRRADSRTCARRLYERLINSFIPSQIFMDTASIAPGMNFREIVAQKLGQCAVALILVGDKWLTGEARKSRLSDPDDMVRIEIETALERSLRLIPILLDGVELPSRRRLPKTLWALHDLQALTMSTSQCFNEGYQYLLDVIEGPVGRPHDNVVFSSEFGFEPVERPSGRNSDNLVLVADDDYDIVQFVKVNLLLDGIDVAVAYDGLEALRKVAKLRPNVVLLDLLMPGIRGGPVCERIKEDPENAHTWVLMVTAKSLSMDKQLGFAHGADDYITKPFDPAELAARVKAGLRRSSQLRDARRQLNDRRDN